MSAQEKKDLIRQNLREMKENANKIDIEIQSELSKFPNKLKDYSKTVKRQYFLLEGIEKIRGKIDQLDAQNQKGLANIQRYKEKIENMKKVQEQLETKIAKAKKLADDLDNCRNFLGFNIDLKDDNVYKIQLTKLPIKEYEATFEFEIFNDNDKIKVLKVIPENCIDTSNIANQIEHSDDKFLKLILLLRKELINKYKI